MFQTRDTRSPKASFSEEVVVGKQRTGKRMRDTVSPHSIKGAINRAPTTRGAINRAPTTEYVELKQLIKERGLLDKQPVYYTYKILLTLSMLAIGLAFLVLVNNFWLQLLDAVYVSFVFAQISFLGHDIGHRQVFHTPWKIDISSL